MSTVLKQGAKGKAVVELQNLLNSVGYSLKPDGDFGKNTYDAVVDFQTKKSLAVDGVVGKNTMNALKATDKVVAIWETIPFPIANRSRSAAMPTLEAVGELTGVTPKLLATFASIESAFDYNVKASTSSASGWFQFINSTWDNMVRDYGKLYGIPNQPSRALRLDPRVNALMGAEFLKMNERALKKVVTTREVSDTDLYLAHFLGDKGATKFLTTDQDKYGANSFVPQAKANENIFYKKGTVDPKHPSFYKVGLVKRTLREIYQLFENKVSKHRV